MAGLQAWRTYYRCHHSHRLNESSVKDGAWNGLPRLAHSHAPFLAAKTSVDPLPWACWSLLEWTDDSLASTADITSGLQLGRAELLRGLRNFLNMDRPEHHSTDRPKEKGVEKWSGRYFTLQGRKRCVFKQTNIGTVLRAAIYNQTDIGTVLRATIYN